MSDKEVNKCKSERTQIRRLFTLQANKIEEIIKSGNYETLGEEFSKLSDKAERLFKLDEQVRELISSLDIAESEITNEFDQVETYRDRWIILTNRRNDLIKVEVEEDEKVNNSLISSESGSTVGYKYYKYPKLKFASYDGNIKQWINFWSQFKKIHDNPKMDLDLKFHYLVQATVEGSPARELISSFPPCGENYYNAIELMKQRFGRDDLLIEMYVRELLTLVLQNASNNKINSLSTLYDRLQTQLRALSTLGVTTEKYACMLLPLVESSLPEDILREWERKRVRGDSEEPMNDLLEFLRKEVESEERINLARTSLTSESKPTSKEKKKNSIRENKSNIATATDLINVKSQPKKCCIFCEGGQHKSENCFKAHALSLTELQDIIKAKGHCFKCLKKGHSIAQCKAMLKCIICGSKHLPILCSKRKKPVTNLSNNEGVEHTEHVEQNLANTNFTSILMQTLHVTLKGNVEENVRVLIDTGSQRSYITKNMAYKLGYPVIRQETLVHALFGGVNSENKKHSCYKIRVWSTDKNYGCNFEVLDSEVICQSVPVVHSGPWVQELKDKGIILSDMSEGPIDLLIGADIAGKIMTGRKVQLKSGLVALETKLGWTIMGKTSENNHELINNSALNVTMNLFCTDESVTQLWRLDTIGICDPSQTKTKEELSSAARKHFLETTHILPDGRYEVRLPWVEGHPPLPTNYELAHKRLLKTVNKLEATDKLSAYSEVFAEWLHDNIIEEVPTENWDVGHYLPHRPVFKENSTTKIRPVFDASANEKGYPSLNQCVEKGQNLIELIPSILFRFRLQRIGVVADIKKAFLQISIHKEDRDFLRFLDIAPDGEIQIYRHTRVVFGVASSPFLLGAVMDFHLEQCEERVRNGTACYNEDIVSQLRRSFYVDNCVTSLVDEHKLQEFVQQSTSIFAEAKFELRGWEWTDPLSTEIDNNTGVLGLTWDRKTDKLRLNSNPIKIPERVTRRSILSAAQKLFDPIGFCMPATLIPKLFVQETWLKGGEWDDEVDEGIKIKFLQWMEEVHFLREVGVDRWFYGAGSNNAGLTLHVFCDASQIAYAAVVFLRVEIENKVYINLVEAKSRVSPVHRVTIPRLELLAATIGARMGHRILEALNDIPVFYWSDSTTTLSWIKREEPWGVFVFNRVSEIRKLTARETWHHVPGTKNPADLLSRGCSPRTLLRSKWWEGPEWLRSPREDWPIGDIHPDENEVMAEIKKKAIAAVDLPELDHSFTNIFARYFSSYTKIVRVVAWVYRFIMKTSNKVKPNFSREKLLGELSKDECLEAEKYLLRGIQRETLAGVEEKRIRRLKPELDSNGLIRMRTKIWARKDAADFRAPIILMGNNVIVERLIYETHVRNSHVVGQTLLNLLREKFWIIRGRQAVRRVVAKCQRCLRFSVKKLECVPPPLPEDRVRDARIFEVIGIDLAGPLYLRDGEKVWITLFTCAIYRAVHLDIVSSLSTEDFLLVLRRFIARRGRPSIIYTDNGTNFKGSSNALRDVDWQKILSCGTVTPIEWRFNPPSAPWWGGFFERLIGLMKVLLRKNLGRACLKKEELYTLICECESMLNARPITYVGEEADLVPITPRMFLGEISEAGVPDLEELDAAGFNRRLKYRHKIKEELRKRFRAEYLGQLACFAKDPKHTREPVIGEVVLIGCDNQKRLDWPLAVVEGLVPGKDGRCRLIQLRTADGRITRPLQRIYPLEVFSNHGEELIQNLSENTEEDDPPLEPDISDVAEKKYCDTRTRCGRKVRLPVRFE